MAHPPKRASTGRSGRSTAPSLRRVINATGVVLHTNLGRAPLGPLAVHAGYSNLEYDLAAGRRGKRDAHTAGAARAAAGRARHRGQQQCRGHLSGAERTGRRRRSGGLARRADRNRRRLPHSRHHGALRRDAARSRHHQPHPHRRLPRRHHTSARACCCASIPATSASTGFTRARRAARTGGAGTRARHSRSTKTWAAAAWSDLRPFGIDEPLVADSLGPAPTWSPSAAISCWAARRPGILAGKPETRRAACGAIRCSARCGWTRLIYQALETRCATCCWSAGTTVPALAMIRQTRRRDPRARARRCWRASRTCARN